MKNASILIVDDDRDVLDALAILLEDDFSRIVRESNISRLPSLLAERFDIVLLDMNFSAGINSGNEGIFWLDRIRQVNPDAVVILMTAYGKIDLAVEAIKRGAKDFVLKPWDNEKLLATIKSALAGHRINKEGQTTIQETFVEGRSAAMQTLQSQIKRVAPTDANVLLLGENGTGKEMVAREIHARSLRSSRKFMSVDLSAIPESLFESELFGYKKGAFTDARADREGKFAAANGGTLFLDEIGNLPLTMQVKILTVIQSRSFMPVGANEPVALDVRIISATNVNLPENVGEGTFRQDLLYRINTITLTVPPLRDRQDDIVMLAEHFLDHYATKYGRSGFSFSEDAKLVLKEYPWPGNVRELRHVVEKAVILSESSHVQINDLNLSISGKPSSREVRTLDAVEKEAMINALNTHGGNIVHAARSLGITRQTLYNKMKKYGI